MDSLREREIEKKLVASVRNAGGLAPKFVSPGWDGVPDRIVLLPDGKIGFVELKSTGKKLRILQKRRKRQLEQLGFPVFTVDGVEQIGGVIDAIRTS